MAIVREIIDMLSLFTLGYNEFLDLNYTTGCLDIFCAKTRKEMI